MLTYFVMIACKDVIFPPTPIPSLSPLKIVQITSKENQVNVTGFSLVA